MRLQSCPGWEFIPVGLGRHDLAAGRLNPLLYGEESLGSKVIDRGIHKDPTMYLLWWDQGFSIMRSEKRRQNGGGSIHHQHCGLRFVEPDWF